jgi:hypothetical protein
LSKSEKNYSDTKEDHEQRVPVLIDAKLYGVLQRELSGSGFATIDEYVSYMLRLAIGKKTENAAEETQQPQEMSKEDNQAVFDRLKALGYM